MAADRSTSLTHLWGLAGAVPGLVGLYIAIQPNLTWREYALVGSGWLTALLYGLLLLRAFRQSRSDGEEIGDLKGTIKQLSKELDNRNATLDYLAGIQMGKKAKPRATISSANELTEIEGNQQ